MAKVSRQVKQRNTKARRKRTKGKLQVVTRNWVLSNDVLKHFGFPSEDADAIRTFRKLSDKDRVKASRKIIQEQIIENSQTPDARFALAVAESETLLKGYATLDDPHRAEIQKLIKEISLYLEDETRKRPFNALMLAAPGAGKSHFIRQLANGMSGQRVQAVTFNMATMQSPDDMAQPIDELRNLKVNDRFPLLFLDEFDSDPSRYPALLPLLWDGELQISHRDLKLGKAVIVLAGSNPDLPKAMDQSAQMHLESDNADGSMPGKLIDLLSRINGGVVNIPDLDLRSKNRDRRVDKVCVAVALTKGRFGNEIIQMPRSLLRFIATTSFRYGVRSIAHLIDLIGSEAFQAGKLKATLRLPMASEETLEASSLKLHLLDKDGGFGVVSRWKDLQKDKTMVNLKPEASLRFLMSR